MPAYDYDSAVNVPAGDRTTLNTALTTAAGLLPAGDPWKDAFTKLAAASATNRFLAGVTMAYIWAVNHKDTALRDAARAVLVNTTGIP